MAMAGDTLEIRNGQVFLNGKPGASAPHGLQTTYFMAGGQRPTTRCAKPCARQGVVDYDQPNGYPAGQHDPETGKLRLRTSACRRLRPTTSVSSPT
ncbi:MAG: hypothetical protein WKG07_44425 [Hymenobacter sp.]